MKIRTQFIAGIVIFAVLLMVISGLMTVSNQQVEQLSVQEELANSIILDVGELGYLSNDYILYREPQQADRWNAKFAEISTSISHLSVDQPDQFAIVINLNSSIRNTRSVFEDIVAGPSRVDEKAIGYIQLSWSRMAVQNQGMIFDAGRLASLIGAQADGVKQMRSILISTLIGIFAVLLLVNYFLLLRQTLISVENLRRGAAIIGDGDFTYIIDERADDEIGDLARSFNRMTTDLRSVTARKEDLEAEVEARRRAEAGLAQKNKELATMNEEIASAHEEILCANEVLEFREHDLDLKNQELSITHEELKKVAAQRQIALDAANLGWWRYDPVTRIASYDRRYRKIFGVTGEERPYDEILATRVHPEDLPGLWAQVEAAMDPKDPKPYSTKYRINLPDGTIRWVRAHGIVTFEGEEEERRATDFVGTVEDITEQKKVQTLIKESEERLQALYASMTEGVATHEIVRDRAGRISDYRILEVNPAFSVITGVPRERAEGELATVLYKTDMAPFLETYTRVAETGIPEEFEINYEPMGRYLHISVFSPTHERLATVFSDITERKRAEAEIMRRNKELALMQEVLQNTNEHLLAHEQELLLKNTELNALNEELFATQEELQQNIEELGSSEAEIRDALIEKEALLSEIHHRVKNNLTAFISLLSLEGAYDNTPTGIVMKRDLQNRARSMALIHETLYRTRNYSQVDMQVYIATLTGQIVASYGSDSNVQTVVKAEGITLDLARATPIGLIINELITNSLKYAFPETWAPGSEEVKPRIVVSLTHDDGAYLMTVKDNGIGLPEGFDLETAKTLGLKLVYFLARHQLWSVPKLQSEGGAEFTLKFRE